MKNILIIAVLAAALLLPGLVLASPPGGFQKSQSGGFSGPSQNPVTVEQAKKLSNDAPVVLRGNVVEHLGKDKYLFRDASGTIQVEIDDDKWQGQTVTPTDTVEIQGEIDKDWNSIEVDVDRVIKLN